MPKEHTDGLRVVCRKCGHAWTYRGALRSRIKCSQCGSRRNSVNWEKFGHWRPLEDARQSVKQDAKKI